MHQKNRPTSMSLSPERCAAKTRLGRLCQSFPIKGKLRCRMHGGKGSGAPEGSQNALKHGYHSTESKAQRRRTQQVLKEIKAFIDKYKSK